eukprot:m.1091494 g.1091494  ORF g.1091494 m.1091494 type:complete len:492 (-) comp24288_c0_seq6:4833-6308(-)
MDSDSDEMSDDAFDEDFDKYDDDIMFDGGTNEPEMSPEFLTMVDVWDELSKETDTLISVTGLSHDVALMVMMHFRWNVEDAVSKATENLDAVVAAAGGSVESGPIMKSAPMGECLVCMDEDQLLALHCGHFACRSCWNGHIESQMSSKTTCMTCIGTDCYASVPYTKIQDFLRVDTFQKYNNALCDMFVTSKKNLKWCPTPDCGTVVKAEYGGAVMCRRCNESFCFQCGYEHAPASCKDMKEFLEKHSDVAKDVLWLSMNAKECPRCHTFIQKEGGCNWMKCRQCSYEFCWLCFKAIKHSEIDAAGGSHRCNTYNGTVVTETSTPAGDYEVSSEQEQRRRLAHFLQRYGAHKQSADLEQQAQRRQDAVLLRTRDSYKMLVSSQVVASRQLRTARQTLCSSYVFGYFQIWDESTCAKNIFEDLQHLLESRTEALAHEVETTMWFLLEHADEGKSDADVLRIRDVLMRATAAVQTNQKNLIDSCKVGTLSAGL